MTPSQSQTAVDWRSEEGQRAALERRAATEGIEPYDLLIRYAGEHGDRAAAMERGARELRKKEARCREDARRWYSRVPVEQVEIGATVWIYALDREIGWEWVSRKVVGKGIKPTEPYGDVPFLRLLASDFEYDWSPGPDTEVDLKDPRS